MPNRRRMNAGNPAFAGLHRLIGKMNLLSSLQMNEETPALGRRKNLQAQPAFHLIDQRINLCWLV
jgi:hypothetical protein